jgi:hypothetical protein
MSDKPNPFLNVNHDTTRPKSNDKIVSPFDSNPVNLINTGFISSTSNDNMFKGLNGSNNKMSGSNNILNLAQSKGINDVFTSLNANENENKLPITPSNPSEALNKTEEVNKLNTTSRLLISGNTNFSNPGNLFIGPKTENITNTNFVFGKNANFNFPNTVNTNIGANNGNSKIEGSKLFGDTHPHDNHSPGVELVGSMTEINQKSILKIKTETNSTTSFVSTTPLTNFGKSTEMKEEIKTTIADNKPSGPMNAFAKISGDKKVEPNLLTGPLNTENKKTELNVSTGLAGVLCDKKPESNISTNFFITGDKIEEAKSTITVNTEKIKTPPINLKRKVRDITGISKEEGNYSLTLVKIENLSATQDFKAQLSEIELNALMNKNIEELINKWKHELDNEVHTFESLSQKLKNYELVFKKNFETVYNTNYRFLTLEMS